MKLIVVFYSKASPNIAGAASGYGSLYLSDTYKFLKLRILTSKLVSSFN